MPDKNLPVRPPKPAPTPDSEGQEDSDRVAFFMDGCFVLGTLITEDEHDLLESEPAMAAKTLWGALEGPAQILKDAVVHASSGTWTMDFLVVRVDRVSGYPVGTLNGS